MNSPLLISGPSGVGKSYLAKYLQLNYDCKRITPITTRPQRLKEINGIDYIFLNDSQYQTLADKGELFMNNEFFGAKYGFSRESVNSILQNGLTPITEIYTPKITQFIYSYPKSVGIFLMPSTEELLQKRMKLRGDSDDNIQTRLIEEQKEVRDYIDFYYQFYIKNYSVDEFNFRSIVKDIESSFFNEARISGEHNHYFYKR